MHAVSLDLSFLCISGYTVGLWRETGLHVGALGDTGAGKEPIFILYLSRLGNETREDRFVLDLRK